MLYIHYNIDLVSCPKAHPLAAPGGNFCCRPDQVCTKCSGHRCKTYEGITDIIELFDII